jgi:hypothetical protein
MVQVQQDIAKATNRLKRHTDSWKKYSDIWKADRVSLLDKFKAKAPPTPAFEEKFAKFQKVCIWNGHSVCVFCANGHMVNKPAVANITYTNQADNEHACTLLLSCRQPQA